ncbi:helix-turn-helix domain-containing protein [Ruminococcaceae bacterium OttesenSCG-928-I18]|nr:helix-turn-helix domain-containing protein [Ruminococcaceae bacterium OttesenSCG-928-I18]
MKLADMRRQVAMTQMDVAIEVGAKQSSVSYWEQGVYEPSLAQAKALAALYKVTTDDIIDAFREAKETA